METGEKKELGQFISEILPEKRTEEVINSYKNSIDSIKNKISKFISTLSVQETQLFLNKEGRVVVQTPHYDPNQNAIFMDDRVDNYEYIETWKHEIGHFVDHQMGWPSHETRFTNAIEMDMEGFMKKEGREILGDMLEELENSEALDSRHVSDIFSGLFYDKIDIRIIIEQTYYKLGAAFYRHKDSYWNGTAGPQKAVEGEIFANLFAIYTENNQEIVEFMEKWFPKITDRFKHILEN